ncbi:MAG: hypothetical protein M1830_010767 [Pleopsidium flavum]|nr:MAG: hypothetical protein M1830_010767 [Pleopsidium flavum]
MRGPGQSSSGNHMRALKDDDAQVARRLQDMLDEEASLEVISKLSMEKEKIPYRTTKERETASGSSKGKGRARGYDDDDEDEDGNGYGRPARSRRADAVKDSGTYDNAPSIDKGRGKTRESDPGSSWDRSITSNPAHANLTASEGEHPQQLQDSLNVLQQFYAGIINTKCYRCRSSVGSLDIKALVGKWAEDAGVKSENRHNTSICAIKCNRPACGAFTCLGCGEKPSTGINTCEVEDLLLDWCCDDGRIFAIWLFLARYDQVELQMQAKHAAKVAEVQTKSGKVRETRDKGVGYATYTREDERELMDAIFSEEHRSEGITFAGIGPSMKGFRSADEKTDALLRQILSFLCKLLPCASNEAVSRFDNTPPTTLISVLQLSLLLDKLAELLRNDSINDLTKRSSLYFAAFRFAEVLGSHQATVGLVVDGRYSKSRSKGLQAMSEGGANTLGASSKTSRSSKDEELLVVDDSAQGLSPALISRLRNLYKQSQIILGQAMKVEDAFRGKTGQVALDLCEQIVVTYTKITSMTRGKERISDQAAKKGTWANYHEKHALEQTDDVLESFHYQRGLRELQRMRSPPLGRMQYLVKEIATLATSLPEGVFVKSCQSTPGAFKCLMIGPEDTPYAGGLFEFDIFAGPNFPVEPPKVFFCTTGGGLVTFNPNLYGDGKVCLSLINTFDGRPEERWQPKKSTIISILVSIQSMILCSEPWRNEPGNNNARDRYALDACKEYNIQRQCLTVRYAMLNWVTSVVKRRGLWDEIVRTHFKVNGDQILRTVKQWSRENPGIRSFREQTAELAAVRTYRRGGTDLLSELEKLMEKIR